MYIQLFKKKNQPVLCLIPPLSLSWSRVGHLEPFLLFFLMITCIVLNDVFMYTSFFSDLDITCWFPNSIYGSHSNSVHTSLSNIIIFIPLSIISVTLSNKLLFPGPLIWTVRLPHPHLFSFLLPFLSINCW